MDKTTLPGLVIGIGALLLSVILEGGELASLLNVPAAVLVFGGTIGAAIVSFTIESVLQLPKSLGRAFLDRPQHASAIIDTFVKLADKARREGLLALEREAESLDDFGRKGVLLVVDGSDPSLVREVLETEVDAMQRRHKAGYSVLEAMGGYAPTMGIIGTVMGLVNVLSRLDDPSELGHSIATAFIATLYGVASANVIWLPLGNKLKHKSAEEAWLRELTIEGILAVQAGNNPRLVREKLEAQLAPSRRSNARAKGGEPAAPTRPPAPAAAAGGR
ncbi:MAG: flagellar motor protein [Chloroflexi bacterium]|nr:flagellar motor protein [Chloroflexota bacterium]